MNFYGLFGKTLGHSISPQIHHKIYQEANIEAAYKKFEVEEEKLEIALEGMKVLTIRGANVTIPYKNECIAYLDEISPLAKKLNAVNTIINENGTLKGDNTDYAGIALTYQRRNWQVKGSEAFILGTGGGAHAEAQYLLDQGAKKVVLVSRHPVNYQGQWECISYEELANLKGDILVNATPIGMHPNIEASPVSRNIVNKFTYLHDLTYNPAETKFLLYGRELGKKYANGLDMLIGQAIKSVEIWEERTFDEDFVEKLLDYFSRVWR